MIPEAKLKISLQELSLQGSRILAQQSETSYAQALQQVQLLNRTSKVKPSSKKSRFFS
jgi:hypothetical protein